MEEIIEKIYLGTENDTPYYVWRKKSSKVLHRLDGPAIDNIDKQWYYDGMQIPIKSQEAFEKYLKMKSFW